MTNPLVEYSHQPLAALETLERVMTRLGEGGIKWKRTKCKFMLPRVEYLGYHISGDGIRPTKEKRRAIVDHPKTPHN